MNRVPGQALYLKDLNCGCVDPYKDLGLNPAARVDVAEGTYSQASPYLNDYRQARRPTKQFSLGRRFSLEKWHSGMSFQIRAEFFNAFNRLQLAAPWAAATPFHNTVNATGASFRSSLTDTRFGTVRPVLRKHVGFRPE
jgi:hypothetical protein